VRTALLHMSRAAASVLSAALVGRFGIAVLAALAFLAIMGMGMVCWIVSSTDRSINLSRILYARRGDRRALTSQPSSRMRSPKGQ
jgi:hypothetical protein